MKVTTRLKEIMVAY